MHLRELNRPRFCRNSITFANQSIIGTYPYTVFLSIQRIQLMYQIDNVVKF